MKRIERLRMRWVAWVWNHTPTCAEMARLTSQSFEKSLTVESRLRMGLHYLICAWCNRYAKHLVFLRAAAVQADRPAAETSTSHLCLSEAAKRRIVQTLQMEQANL